MLNLKNIKKRTVIISMVGLLSIILLFGIGVVSYNYTHPDLTSEQIITKMQKTDLPIDNIRVYDEQSDWNKLLGRPNQYTSKINFADTRLEQPEDIDNPNGGSIEVFNNSKDLDIRKTYIENNAKKIPGLTEYHVVNGNYLLRLNRDLTNEQVEEYKKVFMSIK